MQYFLYKLMGINQYMVIIFSFTVLFTMLEAKVDTHEMELKVCQESHEELKKQFKKTKETVDYTIEKFRKFNHSVKGWREATTKRTQKENIKAIDGLLDDTNEEVIKAALRKVLGEDIVKNIEEAEKLFGVKLSDRINLWNVFAKDPRKAYDYMYNLSSIDRKLREKGVYEKLESVQKSFGKAGEFIDKAGDLISFVDLFNPNQVDPNSPTSSLKAIGNVLGQIKTVSDRVPGLGHIINFYIEATEAFTGALDRLDKKLIDVRQGALCGQIGRYAVLSPAFDKDCPNCDCLTFLSIDESYPMLKPVRAWEGFDSSDIFLFLDDTQHGMIRKKDFELLYKSYVRLVKNSFNKDLINHEVFNAYLFSTSNKYQYTGKSPLSKIRIEMLDIYKKINHSKKIKSRFINVLKKMNELDNTMVLVSKKGSHYSLWHAEKDEFYALYLFDKTFRKKIKELVFLYSNHMIGKIKLVFPKGSKNIGASSIHTTINENVAYILSSEKEKNGIIIQTLVPYNQKTNIFISVKGYKRVVLKNLRFNSLSDKIIVSLDKEYENDDNVTVPQDEGIETGEGSGDQEIKNGFDKGNETPESIKESEKKEVSKDDDTVTVPQDEGAETGEESEDQEVKDDSIKPDLTKLARQKWDWFKKDVSKYLNKLFAKSEGEYGLLERRVHQFISEKKGTQEEANKCLVDAKKEAKALRKLIGKAKKEHPEVLRKMHDNQGNPNKILAHIKDFVSKYKIPEDLKISVSYSSPCLDAPDNKATKELKVSISGSKSYSINPKETVNLNANVSGGKAPVKIHWEGGNISPSGATAIFAATTPGNYSVQVTAKDASGQSKSDAVMITVKELNLPILSALPNEVYYGTSKKIVVEGVQIDLPDDPSEENTGGGVDCTKYPDNPFCVSTDTDAVKKPCKNPFDEDCSVRISQDSDGSHVGIIMAPADDTEDFDTQPVMEEKEENKYEYVWISSAKGIEFDPPSGKNLSVNVTFGNIGNVEIWAEVHKDGELVGETEPITTKVIPPKFTLTALPVSSYIGDEIKATIDVQPNIDNKYLNFRWLPMGENVQQLGELKEGRVYRLKLKSIKSTTLEVGVWAQPYAEKEIAYLKYAVSAKPYDISVSEPKRLGKAPWKWDSKQGKAVELPQAIAVFQNAEVHCIITPKPKEKVKYQWTVSPEGCTVSAPGSRSTNLNAHETGTYTVLVKVSDKNGVALGQRSTTLTVTVSQRDQEVAKQKAEDQKKAQGLLQEGRKLWKEGKLQQAIAKVAQAQKIVGKDKEITKRLNTTQKEKKQLDNKLTEASKLIKQGKLDGAKKALEEASVISAKYKKYKEVLKQLADAKKKVEEKKKQKAEDQKKAQELLQKGDKLWKEGRLSKAIVSIQKAQKILYSNQRIKQLISKMQKEKKQIDKLLQQTGTKINQKKFKEAKVLLTTASKISQKYPPYVEMLKRVKEAEKSEKEKRKTMQKLQKLLKKADALWKNGTLNKAIDTMKQAQKLLPKNKKIQKLLNRMRKDKKQLDKLLKDADSKIDQKQLETAQEILKKAASINSKYPTYKNIMKKLESAKAKVKAEAHTKEVARVQAIADQKKRDEATAAKKAALFKKIKDIREAAEKAENDKAEAEKQAKAAEKQAALAKQIQEIREAAEKEANNQAEAEKQEALAQKIRDAAEKPEKDGENAKPTSIEVNPTGGYWKLIETKGSIGRECAPKERYNDYYRDTVSGFGNHVVYTRMIRKGNKVYWKGEGKWKHPPEILYSGSTIEFSATINRLLDTKKYNRGMKIYFDLYDMQCGSTGGGEGIGNIVLNPKSPNTVRKTITWNVKKPSRRHKEEGEKMTIRVCSNSNQSICGENQGMKYYYEWVPEGSTSTDLNTGKIDGIGSISKDDAEALGAISRNLKEGIKEGRERMKKAEQRVKEAALAKKIRKIREEAEKEATGVQGKIESTVHSGNSIINKTGLTPVKIKLTTTKESYSSSDGTITSYITLSFWNVGAMVTGYEQAILDIKSVASNGEVQNFHYVGTFDGGANGDMVLTAKGMTVHISVIGGEKVTFDGEGISVKIPNPSVFEKN